MLDNRPILLLEDDEVDVMTVKRSLKELKSMNPLIVVGNGQEGLDYLYDDKNEKPCLIISDVNMPQMNGIEFLNEIKSNETLKMIPVVILTTSKEDQHKMDSFKLSVAGYIIKPIEYDSFVKAIGALKLYWGLSELPDSLNKEQGETNEHI